MVYSIRRLGMVKSYYAGSARMIRSLACLMKQRLHCWSLRVWRVDDGSSCLTDEGSTLQRSEREEDSPCENVHTRHLLHCLDLQLVESWSERQVDVVLSGDNGRASGSGGNTHHNSSLSFLVFGPRMKHEIKSMPNNTNFVRSLSLDHFRVQLSLSA